MGSQEQEERSQLLRAPPFIGLIACGRGGTNSSFRQRLACRSPWQGDVEI